MTVRRSITTALVLAAGAALASCTAGGGDQQAKSQPAPSASPHDIDNAAAGLQQVYTKSNEPQEGVTTHQPVTRKPNAPARAALNEPEPATAVDSGDDLQVALPGSAPKTNTSGFRTSPPARNSSTRVGAADYTPDRKGRLLDELADVISAEPLTISSTFGRAAQLTILGALENRPPSPRLAELNERLTPQQREALSAVKSVVASLPAQRDGDSQAIAQLLRSAADGLDITRSAIATNSLDVPTVALCRRVDSFGKFTPLASGALVAGKTSAAYMYVEVEHFGHRLAGTDASTGADQFQVEIGQEIEVRSSDGTLVLHIPEQVAKDTATRKRRDFYTFQRLDFPSTLSVGTYSIKVIVHDRITNATREEILPLQVVADQNIANMVPAPVKVTAVPTP